jgi:excisionase family DNA binding protein
MSAEAVYRSTFKGYPDVLDVPHVAEILGVSSKTVYGLLAKGTLNSLKVGRAFKVPKLYLMQYLRVLGSTQGMV